MADDDSNRLQDKISFSSAGYEQFTSNTSGLFSWREVDNFILLSIYEHQQKILLIV